MNPYTTVSLQESEERMRQAQQQLEHVVFWANASMALYGILLILNLVFTISTLIKCVRCQNSEKTMWVLIIILVPTIGWIMYRVMAPEKSYDDLPEIHPRRMRSVPMVKTRFPPPPSPPPPYKNERAVANAVQASMDELVRKRRASRNT